MASELKFLKGMNKDTGLVDQIDGTHRDALNAVIDINKGAVSNEFGNKLVAPTGYSPVGQIALPDDNFIIFGTDGYSSVIMLVNTELNSVTNLLITNPTSVKGHLNFDLNHPITGEFRVSPTGEVLIYFTDNKVTFTIEPATKIEYPSEYNPPRVFNVTRQQAFIAGGGASNYLYSAAPGQSITMLDLFMDAGRIPEFSSVTILQGGGVPSATYYLGVSYADKDFTETNVLGMSNPVYLTPSIDKYIPFEMVNGAPADSATNKSIKWTLTNVNTDYKYIVPYVVKRIAGVDDAVYKLEFTEITGSTVAVTYSGLEQIEKTTKEDAVTDKIKYLSAKSLAQLDNKLYAANLTARKDIGFQRFANGIGLSVVAKAISNFDPRVYDMYNVNKGYGAIFRINGTYAPQDFEYINKVVYPVQNGKDRGYRDTTRLYKEKTYRRGEVYAFYISLVLKDGSETYAYHIPGRKVSAVNAPPGHPNWEKEGMVQNIPDASFNPNEFLTTDPSCKYYQYIDTSMVNNLSTGYWENQNETYPNTPDFDVWSVNGTGDPVNLNQSLIGSNVRHHKMPSNHNPLFSTVLTNTDFSYPNLTFTVPNTLLAEELNQTPTTFNDTVRILGFSLTNLRIPKFILQQIQGYKIYYAKRTQGNKTIIGQSGLHPGTWVQAGNLASTRTSAADGPYYSMWYLGGLLQGNSNFYMNPIPWASNGSGGLVQNVFKFHDFTLLRKQHSLAAATHIDIQYVATMQQWRGRHRGINSSSSGLYEAVRSGSDSEYTWISSDLGNATNLDISGSDKAQYGPSGMTGLLMVAAMYSIPGTSGVDVGQYLDYATLPIPIGWYGAQSQLTKFQTIFPLDPDSASYLGGLSFLKNSSATGFKGASYLVNNSGESSIALGLKSGIPPLAGYKYTAWAASDADYLTKIPLSSPKGKYGRPNMYIANLCSTKTDVFEPFDEQELIWTGVYQTVLGVNLTTGAYDAKTNYYTGVTTTNYYGGDTYICRYSYRTTGQRFAMRYFNYNTGEVGMLNNGYYNPTVGANGIQTVNDFPGMQLLPSSYGGGYDGDYNPETTLFQIIVESDDNINYRYAGDPVKGVATADSVYFDKYTAADVLWKSPLHDQTKMDNLLYGDHYSAVQDIRVTIPYPKKDKSTSLYPNRVIRSMVQDGNYTDTYRYFMAIDFKDFGQNKGSITNIFNLNALIHIHTEKSLFKTKGKQNLELADSSQAYIGSGDLFAQEPDEFIQSTDGYMGLTNKMGALVTKDGYVYIARNSKKIFLITDKVQDLTDLGMTTWARENIPFVIEGYGLSLSANGINPDAPTNNFGFLTTYDPLFKRVIITKRELVPTAGFISSVASGGIYITNGVPYFKKDKSQVSISPGLYFTASGWTISLSLDVGFWASRHSYTPPLYAFNTRYLYSFGKRTADKLPGTFYVHNDYTNPGNFYGTLFNFELEFISTGDATTTKDGTVSTTKHTNKIYSAVTYLVETYKPSATNITQVTNVWEPGFTSFYIYTTEQISGLKDLVYLQNIRKIDHSWVFNDFRDMSKIDFSTSLDSGQINVHGDDYNGSYLPTSSYSMFTSEGVINPNYIDSAKPWYEQRKFVDKFLGVRLISNNKAKNLINLYTAKAAYRLSNR